MYQYTIQRQWITVRTFPLGTMVVIQTRLGSNDWLEGLINRYVSYLAFVVVLFMCLISFFFLSLYFSFYLFFLVQCIFVIFHLFICVCKPLCWAFSPYMLSLFVLILSTFASIFVSAFSLYLVPFYHPIIFVFVSFLVWFFFSLSLYIVRFFSFCFSPKGSFASIFPLHISPVVLSLCFCLYILTFYRKPNYHRLF